MNRSGNYMRIIYTSILSAKPVPVFWWLQVSNPNPTFPNAEWPINILIKILKIQKHNSNY